LSTKTILVVDDDVDIRATLSDFLEDEGYAISVAANGRDALDYLRGHPATSLVLLDLMMPIMNGYQFRIEQKQDPAIAAVPVVVMTARGTVELAEIDVEHVLQKPFKLENLRDAIRRAERLATAGSASPQNAD
jgi:CheY-like chemotaxis protein